MIHASAEQKDVLVDLAGLILLRDRAVDLHTLDRHEANRIRFRLLHELRTGDDVDEPPPPSTDRRIYAI